MLYFNDIGYFAMAGVKGKSGKYKDKPWTDALRLALNDVAEGDKKTGIKKLRRMAEAVIDRAIGGDITAAKEVGDRLEGKPSQALEHSGPDGDTIQVEDVTDKELARRMALLLVRAGKTE